jgi:hypothetical protein
MAAPIIRALPGYRPPQWNISPAMVSITVPAQTGTLQVFPAGSSNIQVDDSPAIISPTSTEPTPATSYVFDAVLSLEHNQTLTKTMHPVQNGAAISSHAYLNPPTVVMYILMSDVTGQYAATNQTTPPYVQQWIGNKSKSVSAYQQIIALQASRIPLMVTTRLRTYPNMLITDISPHEDAKSIHGARFRVEFGQIFLADVSAAPVSARPNDTTTTNTGAVSPAPTTATQAAQFGVPVTSTVNTLPSNSTGQPTMTTTPQPTTVNVPGAGVASSTPQQFAAGFGGGSNGGGASGVF